MELDAVSRHDNCQQALSTYFPRLLEQHILVQPYGECENIVLSEYKKKKLLLQQQKEQIR